MYEITGNINDMKNNKRLKESLPVSSLLADTAKRRAVFNKKLTIIPRIIPITSERKTAFRIKEGDQRRFPLTLKVLTTDVRKTNNTPVMQQGRQSVIVFLIAFFFIGWFLPKYICPHPQLLILPQNGSNFHSYVIA